MTLSITDDLKVTGKFMFEDADKRDAIDEVRNLYHIFARDTYPKYERLLWCWMGF